MKVVVHRLAEREEEYADLYIKKESPYIERLIDYMEKERYLQTVLIGKLGEKTYRISSKEICYVETIEATAYIHTEEKVFQCGKRLYELECLLPPSFFRISRSVLMNLEQVRGYSPLPNGLMKASMKNGEEIYISRKYLRELRHVLKEGIL